MATTKDDTGERIGGARRIGLLPGSFDPVHPGHLLLAERAIAAAGLAEVHFYVNSFNAAKRGLLAPVEHRRAMLAAVVDRSRMEVMPGSFFPDDPGMGDGFDFAPLIARLSAARHGAEIWMVRGSDYFVPGATRPYPPGLRAFPHVVGLRSPGHRAVPLAVPPATIVVDAFGGSSTEARHRVRSAETGALAPRVADYCRAHRLYGL